MLLKRRRPARKRANLMTQSPGRSGDREVPLVYTGSWTRPTGGGGVLKALHGQPQYAVSAVPADLKTNLTTRPATRMVP